MANGFYDGNDGNDGLVLSSCLVAVAYNLNAGEGSHTVVDTYDSLGIVRNECQTVLHAMEARLATIGQLIFDIKVILLAEFLPIVLLCLGQHKDNLQGRGVFTKALNSTHQYWPPTYGQELLRNIASHPQAFTACYDDDIFFILHSSLFTFEPSGA